MTFNAISKFAKIDFGVAVKGLENSVEIIGRVAGALKPIFTVLGPICDILAVGISIWGAVDSFNKKDWTNFALNVTSAVVALAATVFTVGAAILASSALSGPGMIVGIAAFAICAFIAVLQLTVFKPQPPP